MPRRPKSQSDLALKATDSPSSATYPSEDRLIPVELLDEPENAARETFDETKIEELIESIRAVGILNALIVKPNGERYQVVAGHRRLICARAAGLPLIKCRVWADGGPSPEAVKAHENYFREDLNPAEEARYLGRVLEAECGGDVDNLVRMVRQSREYLENRLILLRGDPMVLDALAAGALNLGVAHELNKVQDAGRRAMYLEAATAGGASVRMVRDWRVQGNAMDAAARGDQVGAEGPVNPTAHIEPYVMRCFACGSDEDKHEMEVTYLHKTCRRMMERQAATGGQEN